LGASNTNTNPFPRKEATDMSNERLTRLIGLQEEARKSREALVTKRAAVMQVAEDEGREDLTEAEDTEFRGITTEIAEIDGQIEARNERIEELADEEKRAGNAAGAIRRAQLIESRISVTNEARTYEKGNGRSYLVDLAKAQILGDTDSRARLDRHALEVASEPEYRALNRTDGTGGYFVPPIWLMDDYEALARAARPTANLVTNNQLPAGTDSINVPKIATGVTTAIQTADNQSVSATDLTDTSVSAGVKTIAGAQTISIQALEQSPVNFDQIIFADLLAAYATNVDVQVLSGANSAGEVKGLLSATGINAVTYTDTTPTVAELYPKLADAINRVHTTRFLAPTVIVMHPTRWAWMLAALDSSSRPLVVPNAQGPTNAIGTFGGVVSEQVVGNIMGLPVVTDPSIPTTLGTGTNEDRIIVMRSSDSYLWESSVRTRVLQEVNSATLGVTLQVYGYLAFTAERQPKSISVISGSGLSTPSF
jgi:HK97 family phage major capsid protein